MAKFNKLSESCLDFKETQYLCAVPGLTESVNAERGGKTEEFEEFSWNDRK